jgi:CheY-like chemotaxis protein
MAVPNPRILIVEDALDIQALLRHLLKGYDLTLVANVAEALTAAAENDFDLFMLDINLGEARTGVDLLNDLRALPQHASTPAMACTAYALHTDREHFLGQGFDAYLPKPFSRMQLNEAIELAFQGEAIQPDTVAV